MKLTITGFDQNTGLLAYTSQEVVYGPLSRTYSLRPPVVGFIEQARAHEVGSIVASVSIISAQYEALSEAERIIGRLYCNLYKGDLTDLIGIDYTTGVNGLKPAVELPTTADLDYIEQNTRCGVLYDKLTQLKKIQQSRDVFMVWVRKMAADPSQACNGAAVEYLSLAAPKPGPVWVAQGDANDYCILDEKGHWIAAIRLNGEMSNHAQEEWLDSYFQKGQ